MTPEVTILFNPAALNIPEVKGELFHWSRIEGWHTDLSQRMELGAAAIIVGTTDPHGLEGAAIVTLPNQMSEELPWVVHFNCRGGRALTRAMSEAVVDFVRAAGYTAYKALNQSGTPDKVWLRAFRTSGKPVFIGSTYLFDLGDTDNGSNSIGGSGARDRPKPVRKQAKADPAKSELRKPVKRKRDVRRDPPRVRGARKAGVRKPKRASGE